MNIVKTNDFEGDFNRGWKLDKLQFFDNDQEIAYMKISYIPTVRFKRYYKSIFHYMEHVGGGCNFAMPQRGLNISEYRILKREISTSPWQTFNSETLLRMYIRLHMHQYGFDPSSKLGYGYDEETKTQRGYDYSVLSKQLTRAKLLDLISQIEEKFNENEADKFKDFEHFHVDKPLVSYSYVAPECRCKGIGTKLYIEASRWMNEKNLKLYLSGVVSDSALFLHQKLRKLNMLRKEENRLFIKEIQDA